MPTQLGQREMNQFQTTASGFSHQRLIDVTLFVVILLALTTTVALAQAQRSTTNVQMVISSRQSTFH